MARSDTAVDSSATIMSLRNLRLLIENSCLKSTPLRCLVSACLTENTRSVLPDKQGSLNVLAPSAN